LLNNAASRKLAVMRQRIRWLAVHGVIRAVSKRLARRGDPQGRLIADPTVRANPVAFTEELRARGPVVKCRILYITVDHKIANDLLRSDDFRVVAMGSNLPKPLQWVANHTKTGLLHPLEPPSMLSVEPPDHTRYRKLVGVHHQSGCGVAGSGRRDCRVAARRSR